MKSHQIKLPKASTVILSIVSLSAFYLLFLWISPAIPKKIVEEVIAIPLDKSVKIISHDSEFYGLVGDGERRIILEIPVESSQKFLDTISQSYKWQLIKLEQKKVDTCSPSLTLPSFPGELNYYLFVKCYDRDGLELNNTKGFQAYELVKYDIVIYYPRKRMLHVTENWQ
jgi:hypothetical protein